MDNVDFIDKYLSEIELICKDISKKDIESFINLLYDAWKEDKHIFIAGNGGSASTATHFASDLNKFTIIDGKKRCKALALTDNMPWFSALVNDLGWDNVYVEQLRNLMDPGDIFIAISVHGGSGADKSGLWSQNLLKAAKHVKDHGGKVGGLVGFDGGVIKKFADACIVVPFNSTPHVEGFHIVLTHLVCAKLRDDIDKS